jgi:hypothetical protein
MVFLVLPKVVPVSAGHRLLIFPPFWQPRPHLTPLPHADPISSDPRQQPASMLGTLPLPGSVHFPAILIYSLVPSPFVVVLFHFVLLGQRLLPLVFRCSLYISRRVVSRPAALSVFLPSGLWSSCLVTRPFLWSLVPPPVSNPPVWPMALYFYL